MSRRLFLNLDASNQLGNQLFLFASLIASAEHHHAELINLGFYKYAHLFPTTARDVFSRYPARSSPGLNRASIRRWLYRAGHKLARSAERGKLRRLAAGLSVQFLHSSSETTIDKPLAERKQLARYLDEPELAAGLQQHRFTVFQGPLFRDMPALYAHASRIRTYFRPSPDCTERIAAALAPVRANHSVLIGVHVRRGDYEQFVGGRYFYSLEQYAAVMDRVRALFPDQAVAFWVCSNESLSPDSFPGLAVFAGLGGIMEDLYALARCDYVIGPPSTFSAWASFYGQVPLYSIRDVTHQPTRADFVVNSTPPSTPR